MHTFYSQALAVILTGRVFKFECMRAKKLIIILLVCVAFFAYYLFDYKRHFVHNRDKTEYLTIWQRFGNNCYIIPGKYYGILQPKGNYIKTVNYRNYVGVIWDTNDKFDFKLSVYNDFRLIDWHSHSKIYKNNDSLLLEYKILDTLDLQRGKRIRNDSADYFLRKADYNYIDLNRIVGIKTYSH
jgi:hypothetical protein